MSDHEKYLRELLSVLYGKANAALTELQAEMVRNGAAKLPTNEVVPMELTKWGNDSAYLEIVRGDAETLQIYFQAHYGNGGNDEQEEEH